MMWGGKDLKEGGKGGKERWEEVKRVDEH